MFVLWDADGNEIRDEYPPVDPPDILRNPENAAFNLDTIIGRLKEMGGSDVVALHQLAQNHYFVLDASAKDGGHYIVRIARNIISSSSDRLSFLQDKLRRECEFMRWVSSAKNIPMPLVHYYDASVVTPYMVTDKCEGCLLIDAFGILPFEAKVISNIRSYARIALDLFRIDAPDGIGSISSFQPTADARSGRPILGPYILPSGLHTPSTVFQSIEEYFRWLISVKKTSTDVGTTKLDLDKAQVTLKRLESLISESVSGYDAELIRGVPSHQDFCGQNVFIDGEGLITSVIDWEFHMVKPAVLAAAYPSWIRYDGTADPRFVDKMDQFSSFWMASPVDAKRLRQAYDAIVKEEDPEYYRALKAGAFCRMAEEWLLSDVVDIGCRRMKAWLDSSLQ
ncbi:hypothetical protein BDZ97DRAFT_1921655 [Flammula alnicola]|nr:hypothetical protein BDZ97DRAFT_1921655 [Flammula alnicola]